MNVQLNPPPVPPLDPSRRSRLRNRVMDQASPTAGRSAWRWAAPVVAIGGVAAVVAGTLVVTNNPTADPGVTGKPSPSVGAPKVDRGAVPAALVPQLRKECQWPNETESPELLWTRHVRGITSDSTTAVAVAVQPKKVGPPATAGPNAGKLTRGGPSSTTTAYNLGIRVCVTRTAKRGPLGSIIVVADKLWTARPTAAQGLLAFPIVGSDRTRDSSKPQTQGPNEGPDMTRENGTLQTWTLYRARPEIVRVEARSVWQGKFGEWTEGVVDGGFAYTEVQARGEFAIYDELKQQVRAFDAAGKPVPVKL